MEPDFADPMPDETDPEPGDQPSVVSEYGPSIIGSTVVMRGELTLNEDLIVEGKFQGKFIEGAKNLSVSPYAEINADIKGESADIAGTIAGEFKGSGTVYVRRTARINGAISADRLRVEDGTNLEHVVLSGRISRAEEQDAKPKRS